jgi:hypothetical protein
MRRNEAKITKTETVHLDEVKQQNGMKMGKTKEDE